jgi:trans-2,3-dihydro-3-hydroxyanthranilate isomerase
VCHRVHLRFFFIDVFADRPLTGNPLALVADADALDVAAMQAVAREFNQSETTYVMKPTRSDADWRLRFFTTTGDEVYGAGHNALGAWWWLAHEGRLRRPGSDGIATYAQEIGDRALPVEIEWERGRPRAVAMIQLPPSFGATCDDRPALALALGLGAADFDPRLAPQVVSTGAAHLMVAVRDRAAVDRARPDAARLVPAVRAVHGQGCYVFALESREPASAYARFFNPGVGISEDAGTGSAAGPLAAYLNARASPLRSLVVEQGHLMKRPSRIDVTVEGERVRVSGRAIIVAEGRLLV